MVHYPNLCFMWTEFSWKQRLLNIYIMLEFNVAKLHRPVLLSLVKIFSSCNPSPKVLLHFIYSRKQYTFQSWPMTCWLVCTQSHF